MEALRGHAGAPDCRALFRTAMPFGGGNKTRGSRASALELWLRLVHSDPQRCRRPLPTGLGLHGGSARPCRRLSAAAFPDRKGHPTRQGFPRAWERGRMHHPFGGCPMSDLFVLSAPWWHFVLRAVV